MTATGSRDSVTGKVNEAAGVMHIEDKGVACACLLRLRFGSASFRFLLLALVLLPIATGYFAFDIPSITADDLKRRMHLSNRQLGALFSVYSFPNIVLPLACGILMSVAGVWPAVLLLASIIAAGTSMGAVGVAIGSYPLLLAGRCVYGLGGESIFVGIDVLATGWFKDVELGLAYGLLQAAGQAGSLAAFLGVPALIKHMSRGEADIMPAFVAASVACGAAFLALCAARVLEMGALIEEEGVEMGASVTATGMEEEDRSEGGGTEESSPTPTPPLMPRTWGALSTALGVPALAALPADLYLIAVAITSYSAVFYSFLAFGPDYLQASRGMSSAEAGRTMAAVALSSCVLSPLSGLALDAYGYRPVVAFVALLLACASFIVLGFVPLGPCPVWLPVSCAGLSYALLPSALYPLIAEGVPPESFTAVYAALSAAVNGCLCAAYAGVGFLSERGGGGLSGYRAVFGLFVGGTALGACAAGELVRRRAGAGCVRWPQGGGGSLLVMQEEKEGEEEGEEEAPAPSPHAHAHTPPALFIAIPPPQAIGAGQGVAVVTRRGGDAQDVPLLPPSLPQPLHLYSTADWTDRTANAIPLQYCNALLRTGFRRPALGHRYTLDGPSASFPVTGPWSNMSAGPVILRAREIEGTRHRACVGHGPGHGLILTLRPDHPGPIGQLPGQSRVASELTRQLSGLRVRRHDAATRCPSRT